MTAERRRTLYLRLGAVGLLVVALLITGHYTGLGSLLSTAKIRELVVQSGPWGVAIYIGLWIIGPLVYVPGLVFVAAGVMAWGHLWGGLASYAGALLATQLGFALVRAIGGQPLAEVTNRRVLAILKRIERRPIRVVALLRTFAMSNTAVNYALALSPIGWRPHLIGSTLGLIPSVGVMSALFGVLFR